jgi:FkbM family methyltransferase
MAYCVSPLTNRISRRRTQTFNNFNARVGECDLCAFANVFADYPAPLLRSAVTNVDLIVDLGANVGAFSLLMRTMAPHARIVAVEPEAANVAFLRAQPFADTIEIHRAAVGPHEGTARLIRGINSVTHHVDLASSGEPGELVSTVTLDALCTEPALVKMDIEGGELAILQRGLPDTVRYLVLEWHHRGTPADFVPGEWRHIATDLHGATTWWLSR